MSAIVCFDIRNFSTHVAHLAGANRGATQIIFDAVESLFASLDKEIKGSGQKFGVRNRVYVIHTGDGFIAVFYGKEKCLQGLVVASR
jgi:hypothetical protein